MLFYLVSFACIQTLVHIHSTELTDLSGIVTRKDWSLFRKRR